MENKRRAQSKENLIFISFKTHGNEWLLGIDKINQHFARKFNSCCFGFDHLRVYLIPNFASYCVSLRHKGKDIDDDSEMEGWRRCVVDVPERRVRETKWEEDLKTRRLGHQKWVAGKDQTIRRHCGRVVFDLMSNRINNSNKDLWNWVPHRNLVFVLRNK